MELQDILYNKADYVETAAGNKVSRKTVLCGSQNIVITGKSIIRDGVMIRGDLASVRVGRHCIIDTNVILRPPFKRFSKGVSFFPLQIGEHVFIGENTVVNSAVIGSYVHIGKNCIIGRRCVLKDCCRIEDGTVLANETCVPSFMVYGGNPGIAVAEQPECTQDLMTEYTRSYYQHFYPQNNLNVPRS